jgi:hypothetical protein
VPATGRRINIWGQEVDLVRYTRLRNQVQDILSKETDLPNIPWGQETDAEAFLAITAISGLLYEISKRLETSDADQQLADLRSAIDDAMWKLYHPTPPRSNS